MLSMLIMVIIFISILICVIHEYYEPYKASELERMWEESRRAWEAYHRIKESEEINKKIDEQTIKYHEEKNDYDLWLKNNL